MYTWIVGAGGHGLKSTRFIKGFPDPLAALRQQERSYRELYSLDRHCPGDVRPWPGSLPSYPLGGWQQAVLLGAGEWNECPEQTEFGHNAWGGEPFAGIPVCPFRTLGLSDFTWVFPQHSRTWNVGGAISPLALNCNEGVGKMAPWLRVLTALTEFDSQHLHCSSQPSEGTFWCTDAQSTHIRKTHQ